MATIGVCTRKRIANPEIFHKSKPRSSTCLEPSLISAYYFFPQLNLMFYWEEVLNILGKIWELIVIPVQNLQPLTNSRAWSQTVSWIAWVEGISSQSSEVCFLFPITGTAGSYRQGLLFVSPSAQGVAAESCPLPVTCPSSQPSVSAPHCFPVAWLVTSKGKKLKL